jgi:hypothetical protein
MIVFNIGGVISITQMEDWGNTPLYIASLAVPGAHRRLFRLADRRRDPNAGAHVQWLDRRRRADGQPGDHRLFRRLPGFRQSSRFTAAPRACSRIRTCFAPYLTLPTLFSSTFDPDPPAAFAPACFGRGGRSAAGDISVVLARRLGPAVCAQLHDLAAALFIGSRPASSGCGSSC